MKMPHRRMTQVGNVPGIIWGAVGMAAFLGLFTPNPGLTVSSFLLLAWFFILLWRQGEPPILLLALGLQWLQVVTKVFNADVLGLPVNALNTYQGDMEKAIWLSMIALAILALGMRLALTHFKSPGRESARNEAMLFSVNKLWFFYLVSLGISFSVLAVAWVLPSLTQIALALANLKWVVYFMFAYVCFLRVERMPLLLLAFGIELALGLGGYFSDFKTVFFVTILAFVASGKKLSGQQIGIVLSLTAALFVMSLTWTAVKTDYREYLSGGQRAQIVTRGYAERVDYLFELVSALERKDMGNALQGMADRLSYTDFFGRALVTVPSRIPHEEGALWGGVFKHIFMPRLFFPDKPSLRDDSDITNYYTGLRFSGAGQGTSVSIGYVAESYIDFGPLGMFVPVLALGYLCGRMYRYFLSRPKMPHIVGYGLAVVVLMNTIHFETTNVKLVGGLVTSFLVAFVVQKFFVNKFVRRLVPKRVSRTGKVLYTPRQA